MATIFEPSITMRVSRKMRPLPSSRALAAITMCLFWARVCEEICRAGMQRLRKLKRHIIVFANLMAACPSVRQRIVPVYNIRPGFLCLTRRDRQWPLNYQRYLIRTVFYSRVNGIQLSYGARASLPATYNMQKNGRPCTHAPGLDDFLN